MDIFQMSTPELINCGTPKTEVCLFLLIQIICEPAPFAPKHLLKENVTNSNLPINRLFDFSTCNSKHKHYLKHRVKQEQTYTTILKWAQRSRRNCQNDPQLELFE